MILLHKLKDVWQTYDFLWNSDFAARSNPFNCPCDIKFDIGTRDIQELIVNVKEMKRCIDDYTKYHPEYVSESEYNRTVTFITMMYNETQNTLNKGKPITLNSWELYLLYNIWDKLYTSNLIKEPCR